MSLTGKRREKFIDDADKPRENQERRADLRHKMRNGEDVERLVAWSDQKVGDECPENGPPIFRILERIFPKLKENAIVRSRTEKAQGLMLSTAAAIALIAAARDFPSPLHCRKNSAMPGESFKEATGAPKAGGAQIIPKISCS